MGLWPTIWPALAAGAVALVAAAVAHVWSVRRARAELDRRVAEIRRAAADAYRTGEARYRRAAEKRFLAGVGPASGQIIEVVHDLTDGLSEVFDEHAAVELSAIASDWYYRRALIWLMVRPFAWLEVLRRRQSRLDLTLDTPAVRKHYRFLAACQFLEWSFSSTQIFDGIDYDARGEAAHLLYSTLRLAGEDTVVTADGVERCMTYSEFVPAIGRFRYTWLGAFEDLIRGVADESEVGDLRRVRLLTVYVACCSLRRHFAIPARAVPAAPVVVNLRWVRNTELRGSMQERLTAWLELYERLIYRVDPDSG